MRNRNKVRLVAGAAATTLVLTGCGGGDTEAQSDGSGTTELVLGHAGSPDDLRQDAALRLKEIVEEESDGAVTIEVHPSAALGTWEQMLQGTQSGSVDIVIEGILSLEAYTDLAAIETVPFLYESPEHFNTVWSSEIGDEIKTTITEETGYEPLGNIYRGARQLNTTDQPVDSLDDLQGLTIRTPSAPTMLATWQELGARAEALPFDEVFSAMEQGVIDGQENPLETTYFNSFHEVAPNITMSSHVYGNYHFITWSEAFSNLPEEHQQIVRDATQQVGEEVSEDSLSAQDELLENLTAEGAQIHELNDRDAWVEAVQPVVEGLPDRVKEWVDQIEDAN